MSHPIHPKRNSARVLLTSVFGPYACDDCYGSRAINPMELYQNQVTRVQGPFCGQKVMLDRDLARFYAVPTKAFNQAVRRNRDRFPEDFMFQLSWEEAQQVSRSQIVTLKRGQNPKYRPYAFTEQGVAMLSSVLRSKRAVQVNIAIMRVFVRLREILATHKELARKLEDLERKYAAHDVRIQQVFDFIRRRLMKPRVRRQQIGFVAPEEK